MEKMMAFEPAEFKTRIQNFKDKLIEHNIDIALVNTPENIFYLTGYQSPGYYMYQGLVIPVNGDPLLVPRAAEIPNVMLYSWLNEDNIVSYDDTVDPISVTIKCLKKYLQTNSKLGIEMDSKFLSIKQFKQIGENCHASIVNIQGMIESLRLIKSPTEIKYIKEACHVADKAMGAGLNAIHVGVNEDEVAAVMFEKMVSSGGEYLGMEPFVSSGYRSGNIHAAWGHKEIKKDETILMELAGCRNRYHGAIMRSAYTGSNPSDDVKRATEVCINALNAAINTIRPGVTSGEVDEACRGLIEKAGLYNNFRKRTGYSIGIAFAPDWGEGQIMSLQKDDSGILREGMVFHMPPAIRFPNEYGVGFSHTVLVTSDGCKPLTALDCELKLIDL
ncbi:M24 family metallopeptidase [Liquorilactobacillus mali]|uniref:Creatinase n=1 Tax=Liquorilactobacillus mali KCTC 3596 = DSM 20444 TaxID=1046596 RepID=J1F5J6_9LACO|nr:Xaa-Pro peptidase family protein [Liquorilactobacillus mali]EJF01603.1 creatinase [Liquorilactobacillus mali KCTC 3596 = DSM 20444]KRN08752.1 creatinase [Liquorilactobacillus mali KCTC 3596 = DSM 20444]QFQ74429.1 aminopeptidase P family protein [Liquorilactobacillus mali]